MKEIIFLLLKTKTNLPEPPSNARRNNIYVRRCWGHHHHHAVVVQIVVVVVVVIVVVIVVVVVACIYYVDHQLRCKDDTEKKGNKLSKGEHLNLKRSKVLPISTQSFSLIFLQVKKHPEHWDRIPWHESKDPGGSISLSCTSKVALPHPTSFRHLPSLSFIQN